MKTRYILALAGILAVMPLSAKDYYASSFGIKSNGSTMNTTAIQKAIDFISEEGGGTLMFKVGRYLTGTIQLKDNVTINLGEGAILLGSTNPYDYRKAEGGDFIALVTAVGAKNIAITGLGVIEGQGRETANNYLAQIANGFIKDELKLGRPADRPHLVYLRDCSNVKIQGINLRNSACWTSTYDRCDKLIIEGVTVDSRAFWNNDGIDIVDCTNTVVQKCFVSASDDGICLKSHSNKVRCENVTVRDNVITSSASGIKFGTFSKGGFKDIKLFNNTVYDTFRSAIAIEAVDGGMAEDIVVDGLKSLNTANPIFLIVGVLSTILLFVTQDKSQYGILGLHHTIHLGTLHNLFCPAVVRTYLIHLASFLALDHTAGGVQNLDGILIFFFHNGEHTVHKLGVRGMDDGLAHKTVGTVYHYFLQQTVDGGVHNVLSLDECIVEIALDQLVYVIIVICTEVLPNGSRHTVVTVAVEEVHHI